MPRHAASRPVFPTAMRRVGKIGVWLVTGVAVAAVTAAFLVPRVVGGAGLTIVSGSMRPTIQPGDVVAVRGIAEDQVCERVQVGDVVTYLPYSEHPLLVTHRVTAIDHTASDGGSCALSVRGDANSATDPLVVPAQVRGVMMYKVAWLGWAANWVQGHTGWLYAAIGVVVAAWIVADTAAVWRRQPHRRRA